MPIGLYCRAGVVSNIMAYLKYASIYFGLSVTEHREFHVRQESLLKSVALFDMNICSSC